MFNSHPSAAKFRSTPTLSFHLAINCQRPFYHEFHTRNPKSDMIRWFLVAIRSNPHHQNFQFPAHFQSTEFWNINFHFRAYHQKMRRGSSLKHGYINRFNFYISSVFLNNKIAKYNLYKEHLGTWKTFKRNETFSRI